MRFLPAIPLLVLAALAPVQCTKKHDPSMEVEDTAGDGLWLLAQDFKAKGNRDAYLETLRFLVARYPGSRRAEHAREELEAAEKGAPASSASP